MKLFKTFLNTIIRFPFYIFNPEKCLPPIIYYFGEEYYQSEEHKPNILGQPAFYVGYINFNESNEEVLLWQVSNTKQSVAYRDMYWVLVRNLIVDNLYVKLRWLR